VVQWVFERERAYAPVIQDIGDRYGVSAVAFGNDDGVFYFQRDSRGENSARPAAYSARSEFGRFF